MVLSAGGVLTVGLASSAYAATASPQASVAHAPSWHTVLSAANGRTPNQFDTVIATGKTSGWAFLNNSTAALERTGATTWKKVKFPGTGGAVTVGAASSPSNVWAAYRSGAVTQLDRWNGSKWALATTFTRGQIDAMSVLGPKDVWVFSASGGAYRYNGHAWTEVSKPYGGSALADRNVWAISGANVEHYNGSKWTTTNLAKLLPPSTGGPSYLTNILALGASNVYATAEGGAGQTNPRGGPGVLLHFNGRAWTRVVEDGSFANTPGETLASDGKGGLWIAAEDFPARMPGSLFHYSAGRLTQVNLGAASISVSQIPGTAEALSGGFQAGAGTGSSVVWQFS
jgi:hypothetical protein